MIEYFWFQIHHNDKQMDCFSSAEFFQVRNNIGIALGDIQSDQNVCIMSDSFEMKMLNRANQLHCMPFVLNCTSFYWRQHTRIHTQAWVEKIDIVNKIESICTIFRSQMDFNEMLVSPFKNDDANQLTIPISSESLWMGDFPFKRYII